MIAIYLRQMKEVYTSAWFPENSLQGSRWDRLADSSRLWVYVADRLLSQEECDQAAEVLEAFTSEWAAHGSDLTASWKLQGARVVVIGLDETQAGASGCSIDASVHCMQRLGQMGEPLVDYLRRDQVLYRSAGKDAWEHTNLSNFWMSRKAGLVNDQTDVVNALCANKGEWETACYHPFHASWHNAMW